MPPLWVIYGIVALAVVGGSGIFGYQKGVATTDAKWVLAQQALQKQKDVEQEQLKKLAEIVTADISTKDQKNHDLRAALSKKVTTVTDNRVCFASWDAARVWNESLSGKGSVPGDTVKPADPAPGASITDADLLANQVENGSRWRECRDHLQAIIDWNKQVRGSK